MFKNIPHCIYLIEAVWRIYAAVSKAIIGPDNGLAPGRS